MNEEAMASTVTEMTCEQVRDLINSGEDFYLVDVRNFRAYQRSHLRGAEILPFGASQPDDYPRRFPDPEKTLVVYCYRGEASPLVAARLAELGYRDVRFMAGGHWKWRFLSGPKPEVKHSREPFGKR